MKGQEMTKKNPESSLMLVSATGTPKGVWLRFHYWRHQSTEPRDFEYFVTAAQLRIWENLYDYAVDRELQDELPFA